MIRKIIEIKEENCNGCGLCADACHDMREKITLIGCTKLDSIDYREKLTDIIRKGKVKSVTVVRMEVPCCGGIEYAAKQAIEESGKLIPYKCIIMSTDGRRLES